MIVFPIIYYQNKKYFQLRRYIIKIIKNELKSNSMKNAKIRESISLG